MIEAGLIGQWYKKYKTPNRNCLSRTVKDETSISFLDIEGIVITGFPLFRNHKIPGFFQDFSRNLTPFSKYIFALAANLQLQF